MEIKQQLYFFFRSFGFEFFVYNGFSPEDDWILVLDKRYPTDSARYYIKPIDGVSHDIYELMKVMEL